MVFPNVTTIVNGEVQFVNTFIWVLPKKFKEVIGMYERFKHLLELKGVTAYRVAKDTAINPTTFTEWKRGDYTPKRDKLQKIAEYFNVPVTYFYEGGDDSVDNYLLDVAVTHLSSNLREDQRQIIKTAASLTREEVVIVDKLIKALKGMTPDEIIMAKVMIDSLSRLHDEKAQEEAAKASWLMDEHAEEIHKE